MTDERIAELRPSRIGTAGDGDACIIIRSIPSPNEIRAEYREMLDEIERLQAENDRLLGLLTTTTLALIQAGEG